MEFVRRFYSKANPKIDMKVIVALCSGCRSRPPWTPRCFDRDGEACTPGHRSSSAPFAAPHHISEGLRRKLSCPFWKVSFTVQGQSITQQHDTGIHRQAMCAHPGFPSAPVSRITTDPHGQKLGSPCAAKLQATHVSSSYRKTKASPQPPRISLHRACCLPSVCWVAWT